MRQLWTNRILWVALIACSPVLVATPGPSPKPQSEFDSRAEYLAYHSPHTLNSSEFESPWAASSEDAAGGQAATSYGYKTVLSGLEIHNKEVLTLDIVKSQSDYLVPLNVLFPAIGAEYELVDGIIQVRVPGAEVEISARLAYRIDGELWLSLETLNQYLKLHAQFDETKYALKMFPPWRSETGQVTAQELDDLEVEYSPDAFSLRQFRLSHQVSAQKEGGPLDFEVDSERSQLLASGAAAEGSWLVEAGKSGSDDWRLDEYFWLKRDDNQQWLIGKQVVSPSVVAPSVTITGAQYFYSNQEIPYDPYQDISQSRFFRELGTSVQKIRGEAEAGAIAQLYVNNQLIGETFVNLDGTYDFGEVRSESGLYNELEIVILDAVSRTEIERQSKTRISSESLLSKGQVVTSVAFGKKGNWLDPDFNDDGEAGMFLYRYGLTDGTTLEAGYLLDDISTKTVGVASSIGSHFVGAYRAAERNDATSQQLEFDGTGNDWRMTTFIRQQEAGFFDANTTDSTTANSYFYYTPDPDLRFELIGRYQDRNDSSVEKISYIKPGVFYSPTDNLSVAMRPDFDGAYRSELYYRPSFKSRIRVTHKPDEQTVRFDHQVNEKIQGYMSGRIYKDTIGDRNYENTVIEEAVGFYWQPSDWTSYDRFRFELNHSNEYGTGMFAEYRTQITSGVYFDLRLRDADPQYDGGFSAFARISFDFAVAGDKFVPATQRTSYNTQGTIAGTLNTGSDDCDMEHVSVLVNGANYKVPVQGCTFYLEKVNPGIHRIALDGEFLPIELVPDTRNYVVRVAPSSVTRVDFDMRAEYSAAGQVIQNDQAVPNVTVTLLNASGETLMETMTDQFGYFRVDGLVNGQYQLVVRNNDGDVISQRQVQVEGDFLFDQNLTLPVNR